MSEVRISAEPRTEFGKGGARRTRRAGKVPAVLYGHGSDPRHISLPAREFGLAIRAGLNTLMTVEIEGATELVLPKAIQRHPLKGTYEHVDLILVRKGEKVAVEVPVVLVGTVVAGGQLNQDLTTLRLEVEATHIPDGVEVDLAGVQIGQQVTAGDVVLPAGATLVDDPAALVVAVFDVVSTEDAAEEAPAAE